MYFNRYRLRWSSGRKLFSDVEIRTMKKYNYEFADGTGLKSRTVSDDSKNIYGYIFTTEGPSEDQQKVTNHHVTLETNFNTTREARQQKSYTHKDDMTTLELISTTKKYYFPVKEVSLSFERLTQLTLDP